MSWSTPFTRAFGCRLPLLSAPMAGVSGGLLAAEVTRAGGLGTIAAGHFRDPARLEAEIEIFREAMAKAAPSAAQSQSTSPGGGPPRPAIGFIGFSALGTPGGWEAYERVLRAHRPVAVQFFAPSILTREDGSSNVSLAHDHGAKFIAQVGSVREAREAARHGVDAIVCQGGEAGGHGLRRGLGSSAGALASQTSAVTDIPVLAAGGIVTGRHAAAALCVCDGAALGTRYWACKESIGNERLQKELVKDNSCDDVVRTTAFDAIQGEVSGLRWPRPYDSSGALRNRTTEEWDGRPGELQTAIEDTDFLDRYRESMNVSDKDVVPVYAGEGVGEIHSIEGACQVTLNIEKEMIETLNRLQSIHNKIQIAKFQEDKMG